MLAWADRKYRASDHALHRLGKRFVRTMFKKSGIKLPARLKTVQIRRQHKSIDVLALVNETHVLLIEDKTGSKQHSDQLRRYREIVAKEYPSREIVAIYFKTGDQGCYEAVQDAGYTCFLRKDLLKLLKLGVRRGICSEVFCDFHSHLQGIEQAVQAYKNLRLTEWTKQAWRGFFIELQEQFGDGKWDFVANPSGGFMGFHWPKIDNKYLQLEEEKLCFKIKVADPARRSAMWESWNRTLIDCAVSSDLRLVTPKRKEGTWMTVAVLDGDYRRERDGRLNLPATVAHLKGVRSFFNEAVEESRGFARNDVIT